MSGENSILFNKRETIRIKLESTVKEGERAILDGSDQLLTDNVKHLCNYKNTVDDLIVTKNVTLMVELISSWLNMADYRPVS